MRIAEVSFERLESGPGYNNRRLGVRVVVGPDENAADALDMAKNFVAAGLGEDSASEERETIAEELRNIASKIADPSIPF